MQPIPRHLTRASCGHHHDAKTGEPLGHACTIDSRKEPRRPNPLPNPHEKSPHERSPHGRSPHGRSPHGRSPHGRSPHDRNPLVQSRAPAPERPSEALLRRYPSPVEREEDEVRQPNPRPAQTQWRIRGVAIRGRVPSLTGRKHNPIDLDAGDAGDEGERHPRARNEEWRKRQIILPAEVVEDLALVHGGQASYVYAAMSSGLSDLVSLSMIDAALGELASDLRSGKKKGESLEDLKKAYDDLSSVRQFWKENSAQEAGLLADRDPATYYEFDDQDYGIDDEGAIDTHSG